MHTRLRYGAVRVVEYCMVVMKKGRAVSGRLLPLVLARS